LATERYPQLRALFESRNNFGGNTRLLLVGFIAVLGLFALAARGSMITLPIFGVIGLVVIFFRKLERFLSRGEKEWRDFLNRVDATPWLRQQSEQVEQELLGESTEWTRVTMTENYLIWPQELHRGHITLVRDITFLNVGRQDSVPAARRGLHHFMCDTRYADDRLTLSLDEDESAEILHEIVSRFPDVQIDPYAYNYFYPPSVSVDEAD
jgi:hypothetical protein